MKQLLQDMKSGETRITEVPVPSIGTKTALVRTAASLVSVGTERMLVEFAQQSLIGKAKSRPDLVRQIVEKAKREGILTTLQATTNRLDQPMELGYSSSGTIVEVGQELQGFKVGDRVACGGGGYAVHAEFANVPQNLLVKLADTVDFESAAFTTLGAVAMQGFRLSSLKVGESVAVIGLGLLGLLSALIARAAGCKVLGVDLDPERIKLAESMGFKAVLLKDAEEAASTMSFGQGVDAVLICADTSSNDPITIAGSICRAKGNVVAVGAVGLNIPRKPYYEKELNFVVSRSYGPGRYDPTYEEEGKDYPIAYVRWTERRNMQAFMDLLANGQIDLQPLISHRFPIDQAPLAYAMITGKIQEPFLGVLLTYPNQEISPEKKIYNPAAPNHQQKVPSSISLGVLGAGNYANAVFLPVIHKTGNVTPVGIVSGSGLSAQNAAKKFGFAYAGSDPQIILDDETINIVAILTRHHFHASQILAALKAGKHVFCEKPLAITQNQLAEIAEVLTQSDTPLLMLGFNRRFAPLSTRLKSFFAGRSEPMVAHYRVNAGYLPQEHWTQDPTQGGGRIIGEGCHFIDFLTFLVGENPDKVSAQALEDHGKYHQDNVIMTFNYPDGSIGNVTYLANGDKSFPKERVEVFCGGKVGVLDNFRGLELAQHGRTKRVRSHFIQDKGHQAGWQAFVHALKTQGQPPIPYEQLIGTTQASFAAMEALKDGNAHIINLPEI